MIHTVCVYTGDSGHAIAAQAYAIEVAKWFQARLKAVSLWGPEDVRRLNWEGEDPDRLSKEEFDKFTATARKAGVTVETGERGEGVVQGLLAEARESDLLVVGTPRAGADAGDPLSAAIWKDDLSLLRKAECSVLVVNRPFRPVRKVLVDYQGGIKGKSALRFAGEFAMRCSAEVGVLSIDGDIAQAEQLAATAEAYLKGFPLAAVEQIHRKGVPGSSTDILSAVESRGADFIVIGDETHGLLDRLLDREVAEKVALNADLPVVIAR